MTFNTSLGAMVEHAKSHINNNYIKIYQKRGTNILRPEEHAFQTSTGNFVGGSDSQLKSIKTPDSVRRGIEHRCYCRLIYVIITILHM